MVKKFALLVVLIIIVGIPLFAHAEAFKLNLFYDEKTGTLKFDQQQSSFVELDKKKELSVLEYVKDNENKPGKYTVSILDKQANELIQSNFNPIKGAFVVYVPYFSLASSITVKEKASQKELLSAAVAEYSSCNANGLCELELQESLLTCLQDCGTNKPQYSNETLQKLKENNGTIKDPDSGEILLNDPSVMNLTNQQRLQDGTVPPAPGAQKQTQNATTNTQSIVFRLILGVVLLGVIIFMSYQIIKYIRKK